MTTETPCDVSGQPLFEMRTKSAGSTGPTKGWAAFIERRIAKSQRALIEAVGMHLANIRREHKAEIAEIRAELEALRAEIGTSRRLDEITQRLDELEARPGAPGKAPPLSIVG